MNGEAYRAFTRSLVEGLSADERVVGLVALGSMAERDYGPDEWSDHDFFVVTGSGVQEELRRDLSWLPRTHEIALSYRETEHGLKVVYEDGHLLEFAVFDLDEIGLAGVNRYRVLLDRGGVAGRMAEVAAATAARSARPLDARFRFGELLTHVLVGATRHLRGEVLSGATFVKGLALRDVLVLLAGTLPSSRASLLDDLDPHRRFELAHPALGRELEALVRADSVEAGLGLLAVAERELRPLLPDLPWHAVEVVRRRICSNPSGGPSRP